MDPDKIHPFDPQQPYSVVWRNLPHWAQAGTLCFITFRAADSMPRPVVLRWIDERNELLRRAGIFAVAADSDWKSQIAQLPPAERYALKLTLTERWDRHLDACHGACMLRQPKLAKIVAESLLKFDGDRYELTDFVVMPNHVHLLAAFHSEDAMLKQCSGWKRFTARRINEAIGGQGQFWQEEGFDHLVRSPEHFEHYRRYIARNGPLANLLPDEYLAYSRV